MNHAAKILIVLTLTGLVGLSLACSGGSRGGDAALAFRTIKSAIVATIGQSVIVDAVFSNIPSASAWRLFVDDNEDETDGFTEIATGTNGPIYRLWDTTGFAVGTYYIGAIVNVRGTDTTFYATGSVELNDLALPEVTILAPTAYAVYTIGETVPISATVSNWTNFRWELLGAPDKDPALKSIAIGSFNYIATLNFNWQTANQKPASFYIGAIARKGEVISYAFTEFLITLTLHNVWVPMTVTNAPESRYDHKAVWTGNEMIVWGGRSQTAQLLTGGVYNPFLDEWRPTSTTNAPEQRIDFTATWCGDRMIVWGGYGSGEYLRSGAEYFPATDTWVAMDLTGAPPARRLHTALWTGMRLLIWGGEGASGNLSDGWYYNPDARTWTQISNINAPTPRYEHSAVWTGAGMVVWGGKDLGALRTGGYWDWTTDTWTTVTMTNAPSSRTDHYAGYLPAYGMIVWGGRDDFNSLSDGAIYNPATDTWVLIPYTNDAPAPFDKDAVLLAGTKIFVWGGFNIAYSGVGKLYDLNTQTWQPITTADAPTPRSNMSALWTGSVVLIFGGKGMIGLEHTGAFFFP